MSAGDSAEVHYSSYQGLYAPRMGCGCDCDAYQSYMDMAEELWGERVQTIYFSRGHAVALVLDEGAEPTEDGEEEWEYSTEFLVETGMPVPDTLECPSCGVGVGNEDLAPDPCWGGYLPAVSFACCGHGVHEGYIMLKDGTRLAFDHKDAPVVADLARRLGRLEDLAPSHSAGAA